MTPDLLLEAVGHYDTREDMFTSGQYIVKWLTEKGWLNTEETILDFGAGLGRIAKALKEQGNPVTCYDIDPAMRLNLRDDRLKTVDYPPSHLTKFDTVICFYVLQHQALGTVTQMLTYFSSITKRLLFAGPVQETHDPIPKNYIPAKDKKSLPLKQRSTESWILPKAELPSLFSPENYDLDSLYEVKTNQIWTINTRLVL